MVELFSGIGAQRMGFRLAGIPCTTVAMCEVDRFAIASYEAIWGPTPNLGDITEVERLPECDVLTYSFPCIRGDQRVQTSRGPIPIKDVVVGDKVLTHKGRFMPVLAHAMTGVHGTISAPTPSCTIRRATRCARWSSPRSRRSSTHGRRDRCACAAPSRTGDTVGATASESNYTAPDVRESP